jgi:hypothetical protein
MTFIIENTADLGNATSEFALNPNENKNLVFQDYQTKEFFRFALEPKGIRRIPVYDNGTAIIE